jgi:hypothetical protein
MDGSTVQLLPIHGMLLPLLIQKHFEAPSSESHLMDV